MNRHFSKDIQTANKRVRAHTQPPAHTVHNIISHQGNTNKKHCNTTSHPLDWLETQNKTKQKQWKITSLGQDVGCGEPKHPAGRNEKRCRQLPWKTVWRFQQNRHLSNCTPRCDTHPPKMENGCSKKTCTRLSTVASVTPAPGGNTPSVHRRLGDAV